MEPNRSMVPEEDFRKTFDVKNELVLKWLYNVAQRWQIRQTIELTGEMVYIMIEILAWNMVFLNRKLL